MKGLAERQAALALQADKKQSEEKMAKVMDELSDAIRKRQPTGTPPATESDEAVVDQIEDFS